MPLDFDEQPCAEGIEGGWKEDVGKRRGKATLLRVVK